MGTAIEGLRFLTVDGTETLEDGSLIETTKRVQYWKRKRGLLCKSCQADYRTVVRKRYIGDSDLFDEEVIPFVKVDTPGSTTTLATDDNPRPALKVLNTRYTR